MTAIFTANSNNEGVLGVFKVLMGKQPQLTLLHYNFLAMFFHNNTETFVKKKFQHEDFKYLYKMAQNLKGEEEKRKEEIMTLLKLVSNTKRNGRRNNKKMLLTELKELHLFSLY